MFILFESLSLHGEGLASVDAGWLRGAEIERLTDDEAVKEALRALADIFPPLSIGRRSISKFQNGVRTDFHAGRTHLICPVALALWTIWLSPDQLMMHCTLPASIHQYRTQACSTEHSLKRGLHLSWPSIVPVTEATPDLIGYPAGGEEHVLVERQFSSSCWRCKCCADQETENCKYESMAIQGLIDDGRRKEHDPFNLKFLNIVCLSFTPHLRLEDP